MNKIKVPERMLQAVYLDTCPCSVKYKEMEKYLESALRWLSENSIIPTEEQILAEAKATRLVDAAMHVQWIGWWQRRMFLAPEPVEDYADRLLKNVQHGYTPTHEELDKLWDCLFRTGHGWTPPEERKRAEEIKDIGDLMFHRPVTESGFTMTGNERIAEAYRRGQKAGSK